MPLRKWSPELIIEIVRDLEKAGSDLTATAIEKAQPRLLSAGQRYFGSWSRAVQAAGIDYSVWRDRGRQQRSQKLTRWSRETIVSRIRELAARGEPLNWSVVERKYPDLSGAAVKPRYFGSWGAALAAAGIDYDQVKKQAKGTRWQARWRRELAAEGQADEQGGASGPNYRQSLREERPNVRSGWARQLLKEKQAEEGG